MKKTLITLFSLISFNVSATEVVTYATGIGEDYDWAILNAVENAVRQETDIHIENNAGLQKIDAKSSVTHEKTSGGKSTFSAGLTGKTAGDFDIDGNARYQHDGSYESSEGERITSEVKDNSKYIPAKYKGTVSSFEVVEQTTENGKVKVKIKARVIKSCHAVENCETHKSDCSCYACKIGYKLVEKECLPCNDKEVCGCMDGKKWSKEQKQCVYDAHDYQSNDLIKKSKYSLAILPFKTVKALRCLGVKMSLDEANALINNSFTEKLVKSRKFNILDRNNFDSYCSELSLITNDLTLPENKQRLKNIVPADYILVGSIDNFSASTSKQYVEMTGETIYNSYSKLKISYRILETATMEIISVGSVSKSFAKDGNFSSCSNVFDLLINRATMTASEELLADIFPDYQPKKHQKKNVFPKNNKPSTKEVKYSLPFD